MHIPDGFLDLRTAAACGVVAVGGIAVALRVARRSLPEGRVPLIGLTAAFVFAAQLLNFPVAAGTSGHLVGATLAAVLVGPAAAVLVMTAVLTLQCLMFADGGVLALGANLLNMALVAPLVAGGVVAAMRGLAGEHLRARLLGAAFAAWCSTVAAAVACATELAASGVAAPGAVLAAVTGIHMVIGLGEGLITAMVLSAIARARPELLAWHAAAAASHRRTLLTGLGCVIALALAAPFASSWPDGLEHVAQSLGFAAQAAKPARDAAGQGLLSGAPWTVIAALAGTAIAFAVAYLIARVLTPREAIGKHRNA